MLELFNESLEDFKSQCLFLSFWDMLYIPMREKKPQNLKSQKPIMAELWPFQEFPKLATGQKLASLAILLANI